MIRPAVFRALCACLNLSASSTDAIALIHEAYADPEVPPRPPRNRDIIYWWLSRDQSSDPVSTEYSSGSSVTEGKHTPTVCTTLKYFLQIICYGPTAEEYANRIRSLLYLDGSSFPREILRKSGIFPIPDPPQPIIGYEEEESLWRRRVDLTIALRVRDEQTSKARNAITVAPAVIIRR